LRDIKFSLLFQHDSTGDIVEKKWTLDELLDGVKENTMPPTWHLIVARQYTGLKDKNGKEIYEGDILQAFYGKKNTPFTTTKVYFDEKGYWDSKNISEKAPFKVCYLGFCKCELIGNIYENPELLKEGD